MDSGVGLRRVAVSGATGNIGSSFVPFILNKGLRVSCLVRRNSALDILGLAKSYDKRTKRIRGELNSSRSMSLLLEGAKVYYHFAGIASSSSPQAEFARVFATNGFSLGVLRDVLDRFPEGNRPRVVYPSSQTVYFLIGQQEAEAWVSHAKRSFDALESNQAHNGKGVLRFTTRLLQSCPVPKGTNAYYLSKLLGESFAREIENCITVRISDVYGPGYDAGGEHLMTKMILHRLRGTGSLTIQSDRRDFIYCDDLCVLLYRLGVARAPPRLVDLVSGELTPLTRVARLVIRMIPEGRGEFRFAPRSREPLLFDNLEGMRILKKEFTPLERGVNNTVKYMQELWRGREPEGDRRTEVGV